MGGGVGGGCSGVGGGQGRAEASATLNYSYSPYSAYSKLELFFRGVVEHLG